MDVLLKKYFWVVQPPRARDLRRLRGARRLAHSRGRLSRRRRRKVPQRRLGCRRRRRSSTTRSGDDHRHARRVLLRLRAAARATTATDGGTRRRTSGPSRALQLELVSTMVCPSDDNSGRWRSSATCRRRRRTRRCSTRAVHRQDRARPSKRGPQARLHPATPASSNTWSWRARPRRPRRRRRRRSPPPPRRPEHGRHRQGRQLQRQQLHRRPLARREAAARTPPCWRRRRASCRRSRTASPTASSCTRSGPQSIFGKHRPAERRHHQGDQRQRDDHARRGAGLYTKLRTASHLSVQVERRGETSTMDYTIR